MCVLLGTHQSNRWKYLYIDPTGLDRYLILEAAQRRRRTNYIGKDLGEVEYLRFGYRPWWLDVVTHQNAAGEMEAGGVDLE